MIQCETKTEPPFSVKFMQLKLLHVYICMEFTISIINCYPVTVTTFSFFLTAK